MKRYYCKKNSPLAYILLAFLLAAATPAFGEVTQTAVIATVAADWTSSAVSLVPVDADGGARTAQNGLLAQTTSDTTVSSFGKYFYLISRYGANTVTKVDIGAPDTPIWQYSTEGEESNSNPYDLVFANSQKAYLIRYGSTKAWIVNPSAEAEGDFKIGELDLSAYDEGDGVPEMAGAVIADGKLFVMMQRLYWFAPAEYSPYIAVFDIDTDTEIDTAMGEGDLMGIPLEIKNPMSIQYLAENDTVYVQGVGAYPDGYMTYPEYEDDGGIVAVDVYDYSTTLILDDGEGEDRPYGQIDGMAMVSPAKGYFVGYDGWMNNTLYTFNPSADTPTGTAIDDERLQGKGISGSESGIYTDKNGMLWICNQTDAEVVIFDTATDTIEESVGTGLSPSKVVFAVEGFVEDDGNDNGIADTQEVSGTLDLNGDGVDDEITDVYKFLRTEVGEAQVALEAGENVNSILTMASLDPADALTDTTGTVPGGMPYGLLDFSLDVPTGATVQVRLYFSEALDTTKWYKYTQAAGWEDYSANAVFSATSGGGTNVTLTLEDGGIGDADGIVNGIIIDPSGPGTDETDSTDTTDGSDGSGGSCFVAGITGEAPMASSGAIVILAMMLAAFLTLRHSRE